MITNLTYNFFGNYKPQKSRDINFKASYPPEQISAINAYKGYSADVNSYLREIKRENIMHSDATVKRIIPLLDAAMENYRTEEDMVVYRFTNDPKINPGMTEYQDNGFMNTVKRIEKVHTMLRRWSSDDYILKIHIPKGTKCIDIEKVRNSRDEEAEVILPRKSRFKVTDFDSTRNVFGDIPEKWRYALCDRKKVVEMTLEK